MRKISKLTSATLKRIIAEEKQKLEEEENRKNKLISEFRNLKSLRKKQNEKLAEVLRIHRARKALKKLIKARS